MEKRKQKEGKSSKGNTVARSIIGLVGSIVLGIAAYWGMPKIQKKIADKIYKNMM